LETDVAKHLSDNYGDRAWTVCSLASPTGERWPLHGKRLLLLSLYVRNRVVLISRFTLYFLVIDAEVRYAVRHEYARTAIDVIARRTRLAFLNAQGAFDALPV
jgi:glycerol-3-phosphate dehydrogenase